MILSGLSEQAIAMIAVAALYSLSHTIMGILNFCATLHNRKALTKLQVSVNGSLQTWLEEEKRRAHDEGYQRGFEDGWKKAGC